MVLRAHFTTDDPDELVAAALSCRWCLLEPAAVEVVEHDGRALAACRCAAGCPPTDVLLDHPQLLRVVLRGPAHIAVTMGSTRRTTRRRRRKLRRGTA